MRVVVSFEDGEKIEVLWAIGENCEREWRAGFWGALIRNYYHWLDKGSGVYLFNIADDYQITRVDCITKTIDMRP